MSLSKKEKDYYPALKSGLEELLKSKFTEFHLEITASRRFSEKLKAAIPQGRDLIFHFLKEAAPDITGLVKEEYSREFLIAEFKNRKLRLDDIYQAKKYAELFGAKYALLLTRQGVPEELQRLSNMCALLSYSAGYQSLHLARFDEGTDQFVEWFRQNPFLKG